MKGKGYSYLRIQLSLTLHLSTREVLQKRPLQVTKDCDQIPDKFYVINMEFVVAAQTSFL